MIYCDDGTNTIKNCILHGNSCQDVVEGHGGTNTLTYSLYDDGIGGSVTEPLGTQIGNSSTSPGFVDEGNDDFSLLYA